MICNRSGEGAVTRDPEQSYLEKQENGQADRSEQSQYRDPGFGDDLRDGIPTVRQPQGQ